MTAAQLLELARADGVEMLLTQSGRLRLTGDQIAVDRWLAVIAPPTYRAQIVAALQAESGPLAPQCPAAGASAPSDAAGRVLAPAIDLTPKGMEQ